MRVGQYRKLFPAQNSMFYFSLPGQIKEKHPLFWTLPTVSSFCRDDCKIRIVNKFSWHSHHWNGMRYPRSGSWTSATSHRMPRETLTAQAREGGSPVLVLKWSDDSLEKRVLADQQSARWKGGGVTTELSQTERPSPSNTSQRSLIQQDWCGHFSTHSPCQCKAMLCTPTRREPTLRCAFIPSTFFLFLFAGTGVLCHWVTNTPPHIWRCDKSAKQDRHLAILHPRYDQLFIEYAVGAMTPLIQGTAINFGCHDCVQSLLHLLPWNTKTTRQ